MENEENRRLIHKKAFEDQWEGLVSVTFYQLSFGALSLFSLSLTLGHLEFSWSTLALEQERQIRKGETKIKQGKVGLSSYIRFHCKYQLACVFSLLCLTCMVFHEVFSIMAWALQGVIVFFSLALPFPYSCGEMGPYIQLRCDDQIDSK